MGTAIDTHARDAETLVGDRLGQPPPRRGSPVSGSVRIVSVWGIPIYVHVSWLVVFGLVTWSLAAGFFPEEYPGWPRVGYWVIAAVTALVFFGSVLVHELGHSWVALRHGLPIRGITLFIFGGVAQIAREPASPRLELRIGAAGPLTSLGLAAGFGAMWLLFRGVAVLEAPALWLARINLMVALFNLIPGFPLDGGRIFRAVVWLRTGSFRRATEIASAAGKLLALSFIGLGVLSVVGGNPVGGVWMILIGWFLENAALASQAQAGLRELLRGATVAHAMTRDWPPVAGTVSLSQLVQDEVLGRGRRCFPVVAEGRLRGLLTLREVKAVAGEDWSRVTAADIMRPADRLVTASPDEDLLDALQKMDDAEVGQLPVVSADGLVGVLRREDVLHHVRVRAELGAADRRT